MTVNSFRWFSLTAMLVMAGCASGGSSASGSASPDALRNYNPAQAAATGGIAGFSTIYNDMGLATSGPPLFFVGDVAYFASSSPDTTLVIVGLSLPNKGLVFKRDQEAYLASYAVDLRLRGARGIVTQVSDSEIVRVPTFKETSRTDESVIYRRVLHVTPGQYALTYAVRDGSGSRSGERTLPIAVPRLDGRLSTLEPIYSATPRTSRAVDPAYLPAPRASYVFGVDDSASIYMESYDSRIPISIQLRTPDGAVAWEGARSLTNSGPGITSGVVTIPLLHADVGIGTIIAAQAGSSDTLGTRIFVGFGPDLPVLSFKDMLGYLRYFRGRRYLDPLYSATPAERGVRWSEFLKATDPSPSTPENEALDAYFSRIRDANSMFATDQPRGWLSDRGMVYVALGPPSNSYQDYASMYSGTYPLQGEVPSRVRVLVWEYTQYQSQIVFYDPSNTQQWHMTRASTAQFQTLLARAMSN
jgi:GWxTD domain-containing protein